MASSDKEDLEMAHVVVSSRHDENDLLAPLEGLMMTVPPLTVTTQ